MTLEELRIGNKVLSDEGEVLNIFGLVRTTNEECIVHSAGGQFTYIEGISGILLTVEILINYDFTYKEVDHEVGYWEKDNFLVFENEDGLFSYDALVLITYLHHLQNCYYEFTSNELGH